MASHPESAELRAEVESARRESGLPAKPDRQTLPTPEYEWLRDQAIGIIQGNMDTDQLSALTPELTRKLSVVTQELIGLKAATSIQELEFYNPRYSAFQAKVIKDTAEQVEEQK